MIIKRENPETEDYTLVEDKYIINLLNIEQPFYLRNDYDKTNLLYNILNLELTKKDFPDMNKEFYIKLKNISKSIKSYEDKLDIENYRYDILKNEFDMIFRNNYRNEIIYKTEELNLNITKINTEYMDKINNLQKQLKEQLWK